MKCRDCKENNDTVTRCAPCTAAAGFCVVCGRGGGLALCQVCDPPVKVWTEAAPAEQYPCTHPKLVEGYYGHDCTVCGVLVYPYGCAPWDVEE